MQSAVVVHQNAVRAGKSVEPQSVRFATHVQVIQTITGNMQFGGSAGSTTENHPVSYRVRDNFALSTDLHIIESSLNTVIRIERNIAAVREGQITVAFFLRSIDGSAILSTDASGGVVKCDVGAAFGSNGDTHAIAADIHLGIIEGDVPGTALIVDATAIAVDVQRAVLYGQAGIDSTVDCRALCSLDLQSTVTCYLDVIGTVNAIPVVIVSQAALIVVDFVNTSVHRVDCQAGIILYGQVAPLYDTAATLRSGTCFRIVDVHIGVVRQGHIRTVRDHHSGISAINFQRALFAVLVTLDGQGRTLALAVITCVFAAHADAFHIAVGAGVTVCFLGGFLQGFLAINGVFAL